MVVRMRANKSHRNNRRSHHALLGARVSICPNCQTANLSHRACSNCGTYKGIKVFDKSRKLAKKEKKLKARSKVSEK